MKRSISLSAGLSILPLLLGAAAPALAQVEPSAAPAVVAGGSELSSVLLGTGQVVISVPLAIGLNSGNAGEPISIPLDVYYGVSDDLTIGLNHSGVIQGVGPYSAGPGLCLTSDSCGKTYDNLNLDALFRLVPGTLQVAGHGGIDFRSFDLSWIALRLGALLKAPLGENIAIVADPYLSFGLNKRDDGNKDWLNLPVAVQFQTASGVRIAGQTGLSGPLDGFGDAYRGWLGAFASVGVNEKIDAFASFVFNDLFGKNGSADYRTLVVGANIRP